MAWNTLPLMRGTINRRGFYNSYYAERFTVNAWNILPLSLEWNGQPSMLGTVGRYFLEHFTVGHHREAAESRCHPHSTQVETKERGGRCRRVLRAPYMAIGRRDGASTSGWLGHQSVSAAPGREATSPRGECSRLRRSGHGGEGR